jgi:putative endonuclease
MRLSTDNTYVARRPLATVMLTWLVRFLRIGTTPVGARGERLAAKWLKRERGYRIVACNWRSPHDRRDEIDLVARDGEALVFIEVKTRGAEARVPGFHAVDARKRRVLGRAAAAYLAGLRQKPRTFRCDVVEVALPPKGQPGAPEIRHFENVALFSKYFQP